MQDSLKRLAVEHLQRSGTAPFTEQQLGRAVMQALIETGVNLRNGPGLEEMKQLLVDVRESARAAALQGSSLQQA